MWLLPGNGWLLASFHSSLTGWAPLYTLHLKLADSPTRTAALWGSMAMIGLWRPAAETSGLGSGQILFEHYCSRSHFIQLTYYSQKPEVTNYYSMRPWASLAAVKELKHRCSPGMSECGWDHGTVARKIIQSEVTLGSTGKDNWKVHSWSEAVLAWEQHPAM